MSLYTITFDDDTDTSDSSSEEIVAPPPKPTNIRKPPNRPAPQSPFKKPLLSPGQRMIAKNIDLGSDSYYSSDSDSDSEIVIVKTKRKDESSSESISSSEKSDSTPKKGPNKATKGSTHVILPKAAKPTKSTKNNEQKPNEEPPSQSPPPQQFPSQEEIEVPPIPKEVSHSNDLVPYRIERKKNRTLKGKRTHFQLFSCGQPILHSKLKPTKENGVIYISEGTEMHFSKKEYKAAILYANDGESYGLRNKNEYGDEVMHIKFFRESDDEYSPKSVAVYFLKKINGLPESIRSRKPRKIKGKWVIESTGKAGLVSIKNCILVDAEDNPVVSVTKVDKNALSIEAHPNIPDIHVFTIGISSFLRKAQ
ncbi:hypothetical protein GPJ56_008356 [Histomonas meleagridis]|uniref:uncharacterized protein n=1 Tax=Histomonas meleagridis TaxID=135588 RepID=UPI00355A0CA1|nr:hypothetical protein GPJ56_008356 [Histomonas meleagridis]KAH0798892.1 hypothetical protein GO595_008283 [Histomonas meleagridis]